MFRFSPRFGAALLLGGLCACSTPGGDPVASAGLGEPAAADAERYVVPASAGPDDLARLAVRHHPSVAAARHRAERLAAEVPQASALPDPQLEVSAGSMAETAAGRVDAMAGVKQKVPFPGKRSASASAASSEAEAAEAEIEALKLKLTEQVHAAWWDLHLAERTIGFTEESRDLLRAVRDAIDARVAADQATQADQLRVSNELTELDRDLLEARELRDTARARLNSLLNRPAGAALPAAGRAGVPSSGTLDSLLAKARREHPEAAAAEKRVAAFRHRLRRAELEKFPDFTAGVSGAAVASSGLSPVANGRDQLWASVGIELPLWQEPRRAMIREARAGIAETEARLAATRADLRHRVSDAWYRVETARDVSSLFADRLIPDARQAYEVTLTAYSAGEASFNDLIGAWRDLLVYQLQHARSRTELGKAAATLRAAAGIR